MPDGPWAKYQSTPNDQSGPWSKYGNSAQPNEAPKTVAFPTGTISAHHESESIGGKVEGAFKDFANDVKYGTNNTMVGRFLHRMGAQPTTAGTSEGASDIMASPILGTAKVGQGLGEMAQPGKRLEGVGHVISGTAQAATIPTSFVAPEAAETAERAAPIVARGASEVGAQLQKAPIIGRLFASTSRAGRNFQAVNNAIGKNEFQITPELRQSVDALLTERSRGGGSLPQAATRFVSRLKQLDQAANTKALPEASDAATSIQRNWGIGKQPVPIDAPQMTFEEARDFARNASRMSASDWFRMLQNGNMRRLLGQFHGEFNNAIQQAADKAGVGKQFAQAMQEYQQAKQNQKFVKAAIGTGVVGTLATKGRRFLGRIADAAQ